MRKQEVLKAENLEGVRGRFRTRDRAKASSGPWTEQLIKPAGNSTALELDQEKPERCHPLLPLPFRGPQPSTFELQEQRFREQILKRRYLTGTGYANKMALVVTPKYLTEVPSWE